MKNLTDRQRKNFEIKMMLNNINEKLQDDKKLNYTDSTLYSGVSSYRNVIHYNIAPKELHRFLDGIEKLVSLNLLKF